MNSDPDLQVSQPNTETAHLRVEQGDQTDLLRYVRCTAVEISNLQQESQRLQTQLLWGKILLALLMLLVAGGGTWLGLNVNQTQRLTGGAGQNNEVAASEELTALKQQVNTIQDSLSKDVQDTLQEQRIDIEDLRIQLGSVRRQVERDRSNSSATQSPANEQESTLPGRQSSPQETDNPTPVPSEKPEIEQKAPSP